ncbi:efflux RND transporter periplasmic adaptor subunit [Aquabacterium sp.]|uniref:efflux RND transporter periplasmic adaptor subunit n=1 Tax=Aquabacterium sp. TaxID=1872578 RepID=UPI0025BA1BA9|nr:efflux RND transporter periplasmic adaptor subunit [Aquabacterium sp.]
MPNSMKSLRARARARAPVLVVVLAAAGVIAVGLISRRTQAQELQALAVAQAVPAVKTVAPTSLAAAEMELPARIEAWARAPLNARVSGYLKAWHADIGAKVKAGQLLGEIETPELDQQLSQARSELTTARSNAALAASTAQRWQALLGSDSVSRQEVDEKVSDLAAKESLAKGLQANVDRVQATKQYARLVAPFDGVVTARNTDIGALVTAGSAPGQELFVVSDIRRLRIYVTVPQRQVPRIRLGSEAILAVPERPGQLFKARVESRAQAIQAGTGGMLVQLVVDNAAGELLPGSFATVKFPQAGNAGRLGVPPGALIYGKDGVRVALLQGDRAVIKPVSISRDLGSVVELGGGIAPSDRVIDSPPDGLRSGDRVRVTSDTSKASS